MDTNDPKEKFILSRKPDFCEECQQWKPVILRIRKRYLLRQLLLHKKSVL